MSHHFNFPHHTTRLMEKTSKGTRKLESKYNFQDIGIKRQIHIICENRTSETVLL